MNSEGTKIDKYLLGKFLGGGQYGKAYLATEDETNNIYAIKVISKEVLNKSLKHKVFDLCTTGIIQIRS